jgi:hypothetical protein
MCARTATTWEGAAWVRTRSSPARSGRWWEHSRSNVLNVELRPGSPAASRRGKLSTTHTRPAESVRTLKPWPKPWVPHTDQNTPVHAHNNQDRSIHLSASACSTTRCRPSPRGLKGLTAGCIDTDPPAGRRYSGQSGKPLIEIAHVHHAMWVIFTECDVALGVTEAVLCGSFWPPYTGQIHHGRSLARTPFRTVSRGCYAL